MLILDTFQRTWTVTSLHSLLRAAIHYTVLSRFLFCASISPNIIGSTLQLPHRNEINHYLGRPPSHSFSTSKGHKTHVIKMTCCKPRLQTKILNRAPSSESGTQQALQSLHQARSNHQISSSAAQIGTDNTIELSRFVLVVSFGSSDFV